MRLSTTALFVRMFLCGALALLISNPGAAQVPAWTWGLQSTNPNPTDGTGVGGNTVATDAAGNVYVGGILGSSTLPPPRPTRSFGSAGSLGPGGFVAQAAPGGSWVWRTGVAPVGVSAVGDIDAKVTGIAVTPAGDVYATGTALADSLRVGGVTQDLANAGYAVWVARLNSAGVCQWLRTVDVGGTSPRIALDPSTGGVVVADAYQGQPTFGTTTLPAVNSGTGRAALFVARLSAAGQWTAVASSTGTPGVASNLALAVGSNGQVAVVGRELSGSMTFGTLSTTVPASNNAGFIIAQLSPANQWQWAIANSSSFDSEAFRLAYTAAGSLWVAGRATLGTVIGATTISSPLTGVPLGYGYHFLGQLSANGQWAMAQQLPLSTAYIVSFSAFVVDGSGNAVVLEKLGSIGAGPAQLTVGTQTIAAPTTGNQPFAAALSPGGQWRYISTTSLPSVAFGLEVADVTLNGANLYITGTLQGSAVFGNTTLVGSDNGSTTSFRGSDAFLAKLTNATALATKSASPTAQLAFFPNPAHAQVVISPAMQKEANATLFDAQGREVRRQRIPTHATATTLDLVGLAPGLYVVRCGAASGRLVVE